VSQTRTATTTASTARVDKVSGVGRTKSLPAPDSQQLKGIVMQGDFYYCWWCESVYHNCEVCPRDEVKMDLIDDSEIDLSIVDYLV
jgi:hypothetical protein